MNLVGFRSFLIHDSGLAPWPSYPEIPGCCFFMSLSESRSRTECFPVEEAAYGIILYLNRKYKVHGTPVHSAQSPLSGRIRSGTMIHPLCHSAAGPMAVVSKLENLGVPS